MTCDDALTYGGLRDRKRPLADNAYFTIHDPQVTKMCGLPLPQDWWSRGFEYAFALDRLGDAVHVADMGVGWMGRPLAAEVASTGRKVWGVDIDERVLALEPVPNLTYLVGDFAGELLDIPAHSLDLIYCISVLEDLTPDQQENAWYEWRRLLDKGGRVVFTCDVQWEEGQPLGKYPGCDLSALMTGMENAGFRLNGTVDRVKDGNVVHHSGFNLCCWHGEAVLA